MGHLQDLNANQCDRSPSMSEVPLVTRVEGPTSKFCRDALSETKASNEPCRITPGAGSHIRRLEPARDMLLEMRREAHAQESFYANYYHRRIEMYTELIKDIQEEMSQWMDYSH
ncbi:hypothetical protein ScPMuIL_003329 [Solemya velum]